MPAQRFKSSGVHVQADRSRIPAIAWSRPPETQPVWQETAERLLSRRLVELYTKKKSYVLR